MSIGHLGLLGHALHFFHVPWNLAPQGFLDSHIYLFHELVPCNLFSYALQFSPSGILRLYRSTLHMWVPCNLALRIIPQDLTSSPVGIAPLSKFFDRTIWLSKSALAFSFPSRSAIIALPLVCRQQLCLTSFSSALVAIERQWLRAPSPTFPEHPPPPPSVPSPSLGPTLSPHPLPPPVSSSFTCLCFLAFYRCIPPP